MWLLEKRVTGFCGWTHLSTSPHLLSGDMQAVCVWTVMQGSDAHKIARVDLELDILQL